MSCIRQAGERRLPVKRGSINDNYVMPGCNDIVHEKHQVAHDAFIDCVICGKPRQEPEFSIMKRTRAQFKLYLRYRKQHEDTLKADNYMPIPWQTKITENVGSKLGRQVMVI